MDNEQIEHILSLLQEGVQRSGEEGISENISLGDAYAIVQKTITFMTHSAVEKGNIKMMAAYAVDPNFALFVYSFKLGVGFEVSRAREKELNRMMGDSED